MNILTNSVSDPKGTTPGGKRKGGCFQERYAKTPRLLSYPNRAGKSRDSSWLALGREKKLPGGGLFSHSVAKAVSSALGRFTSVFGMGTGGSTPL